MYIESHPLWVRGLKLDRRKPNISIGKSHPLWVRGLKLFDEDRKALNEAVAPFVGAWIETCLLPPFLLPDKSHPLWVRGLKHQCCELIDDGFRRTLCGCVD